MKRTLAKEIGKVLTVALLATMGATPLVAGAVTTDYKAMFNKLDTNHDGYISESEAAVDPALRDQFVGLDMNGSGKINFAQYSAFEATHPVPSPVKERDDYAVG